jgi:cysteine synthase
MIRRELDMAALGIGHTPMLDLSHLVKRGRLMLKAEFRNPFGSAKDRNAVYLLNWAYATAGASVQVVESTSGNLGVALARLGKLLGFQPIIIVDHTVSERQRERIREAGAKIELVLAPRPGRDMRQTRIALASELGDRDGYIWLNQYGNEAALLAHRETTGPEIWAECSGRIDAIVASIGTGATICGIGQHVKSRDPSVRLIGVEPVGSNIFGGSYKASYLMSGAGMRGPCPLTVANGNVIDLWARVPDSVAAAYATYVRDECGLPVGLSTGAAVSVAIQVAEEDGSSVVAVAPDTSVGFRAEIEDLAANSPSARQLPPATLTSTVGIPWAEIFERENGAPVSR